MPTIFRIALFCCVLLIGVAAPARDRPRPVDEQQAQTARTDIKAVFNAAQTYYYDRGQWPKSVSELLGEVHGKKSRVGEPPPPTYPYLDIASEDTVNWNFELIYSGPPSSIRARSKNIYVDFEGDTLPANVEYDLQRGVWSGYGVPHYEFDTLTGGQEIELAEDVKIALPILWQAAYQYYNDKGSWPQNAAALEWDKYTGFLLTPLYLQWQFNFVGEPVRYITATSTCFMPDGAGKTIQFDGDSLTFRGYGCPAK